MKAEDHRIKKLIHSLGLEFGLQDEVVKKIVQAPFKFARDTMHDLDVNESLTKEEFESIKTNFIFAHLGKLYTNFRIYEKIQKQKNNLTKKWEKRETT